MTRLRRRRTSTWSVLVRHQLGGRARLATVQNERLAQLYADGLRPVDICSGARTTEWTVHHRLNRMRVERRPTGQVPAQRRWAIQLYRSGESLRQISLKQGFNDTTIKKALLSTLAFLCRRVLAAPLMVELSGWQLIFEIGRHQSALSRRLTWRTHSSTTNSGTESNSRGSSCMTYSFSIWNVSFTNFLNVSSS